jgi:CheY-like chemotaxis protein
VSKIVLCVDDSATMQQVADITFRGTEFTYVGARSYDDALDKAKSQKPVVVLADSVMGSGKSGYDLCLALKQADATANVPVVILVGNGAPYDNAKGVQVGADANLPKPWDTQTMLEKVTEIVSKAGSGVAKPGQAAAAAPAAAKPAAAAASKPAAAPVAEQPPRSATIMGMPTIKMPAGVAPTATAAPVPAKTTVMAVPPISSAGDMVAPAPQTTTPGGPTAMRGPAKPAPAAATAPAPAPAAAAAPALNIASRAPMVSGSPSKKSAIVERTLAKMAARLAEASGLEPGSPELLALLKLSTEVVERIVWEVVPELAEQIIRENLHDLTARKSS